jgi:hypothetical protein
MASTPDSTRDTTPSQDPGSRKRYEAPRLTDYGPVSKLTQTGGITTRDKGTSKQVCL